MRKMSSIIGHMELHVQQEAQNKNTILKHLLIFLSTCLVNILSFLWFGTFAGPCHSCSFPFSLVGLLSHFSHPSISFLSFSSPEVFAYITSGDISWLTHAISFHLTLILTLLKLYNTETTPKGILFIHNTMFTENTQRTSWCFKSAILKPGMGRRACPVLANAHAVNWGTNSIAMTWHLP